MFFELFYLLEAVVGLVDDALLHLTSSLMIQAQAIEYFLVMAQLTSHHHGLYRDFLYFLQLQTSDLKNVLNMYLSNWETALPFQSVNLGNHNRLHRYANRQVTYAILKRTWLLAPSDLNSGKQVKKPSCLTTFGSRLTSGSPSVAKLLQLNIFYTIPLSISACKSWKY